jgi:hypothetical protein
MSNSVLALIDDYAKATSPHKYLTRRSGASNTKGKGFFQWYLDTNKHHTRDMILDVWEMDLIAWKKTGKGLKQGVTSGEYFNQFYCIMNEL